MKILRYLAVCCIMALPYALCAEAVGNQVSNNQRALKLLVLIIASDDFPVYVELQNLWRSYMHYDPQHVEAYFIKADPNLATDYEVRGDVIWTKTQENLIPGIGNKTILSLDAFLPRIKSEFDYVLRTNLSSFYIFPRLLEQLRPCTRTNFFCGSWIPGMPGLASGCGFMMSADVAELVATHKSELLNVLQWDDVLIGQFLNHDNGVPLTLHARADFCSLEAWHKYKDMIPGNIFQIRVKNEPELRLMHDTYIQSQLIKMFYS